MDYSYFYLVPVRGGLAGVGLIGIQELVEGSACASGFRLVCRSAINTRLVEEEAKNNNNNNKKDKKERKKVRNKNSRSRSRLFGETSHKRGRRRRSAPCSWLADWLAFP